MTAICQCGLRSNITNSRLGSNGIIRRRRVCKCGLRWSTKEITIESRKAKLKPKRGVPYLGKKP